MSLLELTVVILVMLSLIGILFVGSRAWKYGSDRALCIMNLSNVQKGVRGYAYLHECDEGSTVPGLQNLVIGTGLFVEVTPRCPTAGSYTFGQTLGSDVIPPTGTLYMECSLNVSHEHVPPDITDW